MYGQKIKQKSMVGSKNPLPEGEEEEHSIKCKYMRAAHGYLGNSTFHGISWVVEDVSKATKVIDQITRWSYSKWNEKLK